MGRKANTAGQVKAESITVRLDPKIRYGLELLARKQRRTLSSVVEWALQQAIYWPEGGLIEQGNDGKPVDLLTALWDVEEADRLYLMASIRPNWMSFEEERLVKLIRESDYCVYVHEKYKEYQDCGDHIGFTNHIREQLRGHYDTYKKIASGELTKDALPKPPRGWSRPKPQKKVETNAGTAK